MIVKYYGFGEPPQVRDARNAVINVLQAQTVESLSRYTWHLDPSVCIWLVPGTFDLEGRHVG